MKQISKLAKKAVIMGGKFNEIYRVYLVALLFPESFGYIEKNGRNWRVEEPQITGMYVTRQRV